MDGPIPGPPAARAAASETGSFRRAAGGMSLAMEEVDFRYPGREDRALREVSFEVPAGMRLALVGPSGAGKTTAAHLLLRFFDPERGTVRLAGHDLQQWRLDELRARIALVSQDTWLFNETLGANILVARPEASEEEVDRAVERAALADSSPALPEGLETPVGERGMRLSGGQRQRVAIARAFLKDAPVLVLDEATSHLDAVSEQAVQHALETLMHDRTTVIIAHRLSTVRSAGASWSSTRVGWGSRPPRGASRPGRTLQPARRPPARGRRRLGCVHTNGPKMNRIQMRLAEAGRSD